MNTTLKSLIMSFTKSIDLYNYLLKNHHRRTAIGAYYIGKAMNLTPEEISNLVIAAALHDIGAITVSERDDLIQMDVENPQPHARLGCYMLESFNPFYDISRIVYYHHWPYENNAKWVREKGEVPIQAYVLHVADRIEILMQLDKDISSQKKEITEKILSYKGTLFHPKVVEAFESISTHDSFWLNINNIDIETILETAISDKLDMELTLEMLEQFAYTISKVIDARSKFTIAHSFGVSAVAYELASLLDYSDEKKRLIRVAGLLHDIGKIAVPSELIEKKGRLDIEELSKVQSHVYFTSLILKEMKGLEEISKWASNHHENHDGSGYPNNMMGEKITEEMDIIAYADIYTALSENRPYRSGLSQERILSLMKEQFENKHGKKIYDLIVEHVEVVDSVCKEAVKDGENRFHLFEEFSKQFLNTA